MERIEMGNQRNKQKLTTPHPPTNCSTLLVFLGRPVFTQGHFLCFVSSSLCFFLEFSHLSLSALLKFYLPASKLPLPNAGENDPPVEPWLLYGT